VRDGKLVPEEFGMIQWDDLRKHWFTTTLCVAFSLFFLVSGIISSMTYSSVVSVQRDDKLENPSYSANLLSNGSLRITFNITLANPSRYILHLSTVTWSVMVQNSSAGSNRLIPIDTAYAGPTAYITVPAKDERIFSYDIVVFDPETLTDLMGFVNYSAQTGHSYTLETIPYYHQFEASAWIGEFGHNYLRESYLNDIVAIVLRYNSVSGVLP
jgi:hypothetical protein